MLSGARAGHGTSTTSPAIVTLCGLEGAAYHDGMHHLFLDESGDHSLTHIDCGYPVFVLGGILVEDDLRLAALERSGRVQGRLLR